MLFAFFFSQFWFDCGPSPKGGGLGVDEAALMPRTHAD
jgi:hypothetical protein